MLGNGSFDEVSEFFGVGKCAGSVDTVPERPLVRRGAGADKFDGPIDHVHLEARYAGNGTRFARYAEAPIFAFRVVGFVQGSSGSGLACNGFLVLGQQLETEQFFRGEGLMELAQDTETQD